MSSEEPDTAGLSPLGDLAPHRLFRSVDDVAWRWLNLEGRAQCPFLGGYLPSLPEDQVQARTTSRTGAEALELGFRAYRAFKRLHDEHGRPLAASDRVLDFGCGWGRMIRFFLRDVEPGNLWGIDVDEVAIEACRQTNRWCRFERCDVVPPTRFADGELELVYAYSVFSHLSEEAHLAWLEEFARILRPGGVLLLTTLARGFLERTEEWARSDEQRRLAPWQEVAAGLFRPVEESLAAYDRGEYCYAPIEDGNPHFGFACIPERYVLEVWSRYVEVREYIAQLEPGFQPVIVCRTPDA